MSAPYYADDRAGGGRGSGNLRLGSLFSGVGGLELGLEWAGVGHTVWQVEQDEYCRRVLARHWPDALRFTDVRDVGAHNLPPVDVLCGGFPCQDISYAGKGAGLSGERSGLWYEFARIIGEVGPRFVVVENVAALLTRGLDAVLGTLADLGYDAEWTSLRASDVGAPHRRERVFLIAWLADAEREPVRAVGRGGNAVAARTPQTNSGERQRVRLDDGASCGSVEHATDTRPEIQPHRAEHVRGLSAAGRGSVGDAYDAGPQGHGRLVGQRGAAGRNAAGRHGAAASAVVGWADAVPVRGHDGTVRLIPREAAEAGPESPLFPVAHGVPGRVARLRAIGNAVVPQCAEVIGRRLLEIDATLTSRAQEGDAA